MHNTSLKQEIARLHSDNKLPTDNGDINKDYLWFSDVKAAQQDDELEDLVNNLYQGSIGSRTRKSDKERHRRHCELVMLNLSRAALCHRWVLISRTSNTYSNDYYYKRMGLSFRHIIDILDYLEDDGLITQKHGAVYSEQPLRTRIHPSSSLAAKLYKLALNTEESFNPPFVSINEGETGYSEIINNLSPDDYDRERLERINQYLEQQSWALKGPVTLKYKYNPFYGGRLYTAFQGLPNRKYKIRVNTLINGKTIGEADFNANHLRMNLAVMNGQDAGDTPYEDIMELSKVNSRDMVKSFITIAMGSSEIEKAMKAGYRHEITNKLFERLQAATRKRYPDLELFSGFGAQAQSLEGQILLDVMLEGVEQNIVALPVHDALAVNIEHLQWCKEQMIEKWIEHCCASCSGVAPRVKF